MEEPTGDEVVGLEMLKVAWYSMYLADSIAYKEHLHTASAAFEQGCEPKGGGACLE